MHSLRKILTILALFVSSGVFAYNVEIGGIYYNLYPDNKTAKVTYKEYKKATDSYVGSIVIPEIVYYQGKQYAVTSIGYGAFYDCRALTSLSLPPSIKQIEDWAFEYCVKLENINIPDGISIISGGVFSNCSSLVSLMLPQSVKTIGSWAFSNCENLELINIPNGVTAIGQSAFGNCKKLPSITLPYGLEVIGADAFAGCELIKKIIIPSSVVDIEYSIFNGCKSLISIIVDPNNKIYDSRENCNAIINTSTNTLISGCQKTIIPSNVIKIRSFALFNCSNLTSITIPNSVTKIDDSAFDCCTNLSRVVSKRESPPELGFYAFDNISPNAKLYVPAGVKEDYRYSGWNKYFIEIIEEDSNLSYTLSVKATGNGYASYNGTTVRNTTKSFTVSGGTSATFTFIPDNGYRIKSVKKDGASVSFSMTNSQYTVDNIQSNTTVEVEFEAIPVTTYTLSIKASGNGSVSYSSTNIRNDSNTFFVKGGASATIYISPDNGYRIKSVKQNGSTVTSSVSNNSYTVNNIQSNTTVEVEFEEIPVIPVTTYTLTIKSTGAGIAFYNNISVRNSTQNFTVDAGTSATISFYPDSGNRVKSVKKGGTDVTYSVSNNKYTVSNIQSNTIVEVEFEAIPVTTYTLTIAATGYGYASYNNTTARNTTKTFTVNAGTSATIKFYPGDGHRIKNVKKNGSTVTSYVSNNTYTVSDIQSNTTVEVEFETIPVACELIISATGSGYVSYGGSSFRNNTYTYTVNSGTSHNITITPDNGYRIKTLKKDGTTIISNYSSTYQYTISNISANTTVAVEFEVIPVTTYDLTISATGSGYVSYSGSSIRNSSRSFYVNAGTSPNLTITPDDGYRIKTLKKNGSTVLTNYSGSYQYTVSNVSANTTVAVEFEAIPATTYSLTVKATGNGSASFASNTVRNGSKAISVNKGASVSISFTPDNGYHINYVRANNVDRTSYVANYQYTVSNISANTSVEVDFAEDTKAFTYQNINYSVSSYPNKTIKLTKGSYGRVLEVPAKVTYQSTEWTVVGSEADALDGNESLAAVIWHPNASFTARASNPNLLLYVNDGTYAQTTIHNVIANGTAQSIILTDATSGNEFYCPQRFVAQNISYTHHYRMETGINEARGWETLVLPFDVEKITHESKGSAVPFVSWRSGDAARPFWLMQLDNSGWKEAESIKANRPYIISMPNNANYLDEFLLSGAVTFSAANVTIDKTENLPTASYNGRTFIPNYAEIGMGDGAYALNVSNDIETNVSGAADGSRFVLNLRKIHPFEAYMTTSTRGTRSIDISDGMGIIDNNNDEERISVYNIKGMMMKTNTGDSMEEIRRSLPAGVYIINKRKVLVK